ncbi:MAG: PKD domain-containing protein [Nanoarchaeota archaeon]
MRKMILIAALVLLTALLIPSVLADNPSITYFVSDYDPDAGELVSIQVVVRSGYPEGHMLNYFNITEDGHIINRTNCMNYFCVNTINVTEQSGSHFFRINAIDIQKHVEMESFTITWHVTNNPPYVPSNPDPANHENGVGRDHNLFWMGGDPDAGDTVTYDVYFGLFNGTLPLVGRDMLYPTFEPGQLGYETRYQWRVVANDSHGLTVQGPVWDFMTEQQPNRPPVAEAGGPYQGNEGSTFTLNASNSTDPDHDTLWFRWDFQNDGQWDTNRSLNPISTHLYRYNGNFVAKVEVWDGELAATDTATVTVANVPIASADAVSNVSSGCIPLSVSFNASAQGGNQPYTYRWAFGDGTNSSLQNPVHLFTEDQLYNVLLTVTDNDGDTKTDSLTIDAQYCPPPNHAPVADAGGPYVVNEGQNFFLNASRSYDSDGDSIEVRWDLTDNGVWDTPWSSNRSFRTNYTSAGVYTVRVAVRDLYGLNATNVSTVTVTNVPISSMNISANDTIGCAPLSVRFRGQASGGNLPYSWFWDFDDGQNSSLQNVTHVFAERRSYVVSLTVTDLDGDELSDMVTINASDCPPLNHAPVADAGGPYVVGEGQNFLLNASRSYDSDGDSIEVRWDLTDNGVWDTPWSSNRSFRTNYTSAGVYTVRVAVRDLYGLNVTNVSTVTVNNVPISSVDILENDTLGCAPLSVRFRGQASGGNLPYSWFWDFDDGQNSSLQNVTHVFTQQRTYSVSLTVTDNDGDFSQNIVTIDASDCPPVNNPPNQPFNPDPFDGEMNVDINHNLYWSGGDPDAGDTVRYDVYFGTSASPPILVSNHPTTSFEQGVMTHDTHYFWKIIARDNHNATNAGPVWDFITSHSVPQNHDPVANAGGPYSDDEGDTIVFNGSGSYDPDDDDIWLRWDFEDDGLYDTDWSQGFTASHIYYDNGTYTVRLQVKDEHNAIAEDTATVTVRDKSPVAILAGDQSVVEGIIGNYDSSDSYSHPDALVLIEWDWGYDGSFTPSGQTGQALAHTWQYAGNYVVAIRVRDDDGSTTIATLPVTVTNNPLTSVDILYAQPDTGCAPLMTYFIGRATGGNPPYSFHWFFGDGLNDTSNSDHVTHMYSFPGNYTATLRVYDNDGDSGTDTVHIEVRNCTPPPQNHPPYTPFNPDPFDGETGVDVNHNLYWSGGDQDAGDTVTYDIYFGTNGNPPLAAYNRTQASYEPGTLQMSAHYYWKIVARDNHGAFTPGPVWDFFTQGPANHAPTADFYWIPAHPLVGQQVLFVSTSTDSDGDQLTYRWDFNNDHAWDAFTRNATWTFASHGSFPVTLNVTDEHGATDAETKAVAVSQQSLNITSLECFPRVIVGENQSCSVRLSIPVVAEVDLFYLDGSSFGSCTTDLITGGCEAKDLQETIGNFTVYAVAHADGYLPDEDHQPRFSYEVIPHRYDILSLQVFNSTENMDLDLPDDVFYRGQDLYIKFQVVDLNNPNCTPCGIVTDAWLVSPPGGRAQLTQFEHQPETLFYFRLTPIPLSHLFKGESQIFTFAFNFDDGSGGQEQVSLTILNNPPLILGQIGPLAMPDSQPTVMSLTPFEFDLEDHGANLTWAAQNHNPELFMVSVSPDDLMTITPLGEGQGAMTLVLHDLDEDTDTELVMITVTSHNLPPVAEAGGPYSGGILQPIQFDGSASYDPDGSIVSYAWDFGDGTFGSGAMPVHAYEHEGTYTARLTVTDDDGAIGFDTASVTITHEPFGVTIVAEPRQGPAPLEVMFRAEVTGSCPQSFEWDFGDSTSGYRQTAYHTYGKQGSYTAKVTVRNCLGESASASVLISVGRDLNDDEVARRRLLIPQFEVEDVVKAGSQVQVLVSVENTGVRMKEGKITVWLRDIDERCVLGPMTFPSNEEVHRVITLDVPSWAKPGVYDVMLLVGDDDINRVKYRSIIVR